MLGIDPRVLRAAWTVFLLALTITVIYEIRGTLITFVLALFLAILLAPVVPLIDRVTPFRVPRTAALAIVYVVLIGIAISVLIPLGSALSEDARNLAQRLPQALQQNPLERIPLPAALEPVRDQITEAIRSRISELEQNALPLLAKGLSQIASGLGALLGIVLVPILAFFFIKDGQELRLDIIRSFDARQQHTVAVLLSDLQSALAQYIRALFILSIATFTSYSIFLAITGAPYAVLLAGTAAVLEFIPAIGPLVAVVLILVVGIASGYSHWLILLIFFAIYRVFQDYVLSPALMSANIRIHPLLVIFGILAGGELAGVPGIFFSIPVIAALRIVFLRLWNEKD